MTTSLTKNQRAALQALAVVFLVVAYGLVTAALWLNKTMSIDAKLAIHAGIWLAVAFAIGFAVSDV